MLLKMSAYAVYSDGTFGLVFVPLHEPADGETLIQANEKKPPVPTQDVIETIRYMLMTGFAIKAERPEQREPKFESGIILG